MVVRDGSYEVDYTPGPREVVYVKDNYTSRQHQYVDYLLRHDVESRRLAARELGGYYSVQSTAALMDALINDADAQVRALAAISLGEKGDPRAYEILLRSAEAEMDIEVSRQAREAARKLEKVSLAGKFEVTPVFPPMNNGLTELAVYLENLRFGNPLVREEAADKLSNTHGTQAVVALINTTMNDNDPAVREEAAESLGEIKDHLALPFLRYIRDHDSDRLVRNEAEFAIEAIQRSL